MNLEASLLDHSLQVPDFRCRRGVRPPLPTVLALGLTARLAGCKSVTEIAEFARRMGQDEMRAAGARRFEEGYRPLSHNTVRRALPGVEESQLEKRVNAWPSAQGSGAHPGEALALDRKHLHGS